MSSSIDQFQNLIGIICNSNVTISLRSDAERELTELINQRITLEDLLSLLLIEEDNLLFFTGFYFLTSFLSFLTS